MKILVVDDSKLMRKYIINGLTGLALFSEYLEADDGDAAVEVVKSAAPDLVLMDWNMPTVMGIDALRMIRAAGLNTPVIFVTSETEGERGIIALEAGADEFLSKPFTVPELQAKITSFLTERGKL